MSFFASCNGLQIVAGQLLVPLVGAWTADLYLASSTPVGGTVPVVIGNLALLGTVVRSDVYGGQVRARLVGGYGGWRTSIPAQGYGHGTGVRLSTVVQDAAAACGERVNVASDSTIGNAFVRTAFVESAASDVLWQLLSQGIIPAWYVDQSGVTQLTAWPASTIGTPFTVTDQRPDEGIVVVATEDYASWMPGSSFSNPLLNATLTSAGVHYVWTNDGKFRFEVLTGSSEDRFLGPLQQMIQKEIAGLRFFGRYEYTVSSPSASTIDGSPTDASIGLPDVLNVPITADAIATYTPAAGSAAHIMFVNGQPTRPVCVWTDQTPTSAQLLSGAQPVARLGDQTQSFLPPSLQIVGVLNPTGSPTPFVGTIAVASPITGVITGGSSQVSSA